MDTYFKVWTRRHWQLFRQEDLSFPSTVGGQFMICPRPRAQSKKKIVLPLSGAWTFVGLISGMVLAAGALFSLGWRETRSDTLARHDRIGLTMSAGVVGIVFMGIWWHFWLKGGVWIQLWYFLPLSKNARQYWGRILGLPVA